MPGTNALMIGPSGVGKTTTVVSCLLAALERGEPCVYYLFDETLNTLLLRSANLGMDLRPHIESGLSDASPDRPCRKYRRENSPAMYATASSMERRSTWRSIVSMHSYRLCPENAISSFKCMSCSPISINGASSRCWFWGSTESSVKSKATLT